MSEQEAYARMTALWDKQRRGEQVDTVLVRAAEAAWVHAVRKRLGTSEKRRGSYRKGVSR